MMCIVKMLLSFGASQAVTIAFDLSKWTVPDVVFHRLLARHCAGGCIMFRSKLLDLTKGRVNRIGGLTCEFCFCVQHALDGVVLLSVADSITSYDSAPVRTKLASPENSQSPISRSSSADVNSPNLGEICSTLL